MLETGAGLKFLVYFLLGGTVVTTIAFLSTLGKPQLAAFVCLIPSNTLLTFMFSHWEGGENVAASYAKSLMSYTPAWLLYIGAVAWLLPRLGLYKTLGIGLVTYFVASFLTSTFLNWMNTRA